MKADKVVAHLLNIIKNDFKVPSNDDYHVIDVSYQTLKVSDINLTLSDHKLLLDAFQEDFVFSVNLTKSVRIIKDIATSKDFITFVNDPTYGQFIIGRDFNAMQTKVTAILQRVNASAAFSGGEDIIGANLGPPTPLPAKAVKLISRLPLSAAKPILRELDELYSTYNITASYAFDKSDVELSNILGTAAIIVSIQSEAFSSAYKQAEAKLVKSIVKYVSSEEFVDGLVTATKGFDSIVDNIASLVVKAVSGKPTAPKQKEKATAKGNAKPKHVPQASVSKLPPLRDKSGKFYSLASLQVLLDLMLAEQVKKNMGDGTRKDILNYRTGRFANSVKVDRLTQSKTGMITAFYTYMKYPYQTFEPGFRQGSPASRNPKLLISKSIHEVAATQVANRLRALPV